MGEADIHCAVGYVRKAVSFLSGIRLGLYTRRCKLRVRRCPDKDIRWTNHKWVVYTSVTWLLFHGNVGNLRSRIRVLELARHYSDANIFIFDYHGYGESEGVATEKNTYLDSRAVIEYLQTRPDVDSGEIVYVGHSLGAAVAIELAFSSPPMAMILISPFASVRDMANLTFAFR